MGPIRKTPMSQSCSHRNSVQNAPIESSTALTATRFVNISDFVPWDDFGHWPNRANRRTARTGEPCEPNRTCEPNRPHKPNRIKKRTGTNRSHTERRWKNQNRPRMGSGNEEKHRKSLPNGRQQNPRGRRVALPRCGGAEGAALLSSIW